MRLKKLYETCMCGQVEGDFSSSWWVLTPTVVPQVPPEEPAPGTESKRLLKVQESAETVSSAPRACGIETFNFHVNSMILNQMERWPFGPHHLLEHDTLWLELMSAITSRYWCVFLREMLNSPFVSIALFAVDRTDRRPLPLQKTGHCVAGSTCLSISCSRGSGSWRNRAVLLPRAVRLCHSLPLFTAPQVRSLIWKGRTWRIVRIVFVFHQTNDSCPFKLPSYFFPARCPTQCLVIIGSMFFWWMYWKGSNCDVELLSVCVFVLLSACVCMCAAKMFKVCPFHGDNLSFFPVHVDTCSTTEFKSWVPTRSGVFIIWQGCKLFVCSVLFCCFYCTTSVLMQTREVKR